MNHTTKQTRGCFVSASVYQKFINWLEFNNSAFTDEDGYFYETEAIDAFNNLYDQGDV